jgi:PAS domain S-box-containing protein
MSSERSPGEWNLAVRQHASVARLGQLGLQTADVEEVLREAMIAAADVLDVTEVALFELEPSMEALRGRAGIRDGRVVGRRSMGRVRLPAGRGSLPGFAAVQDGPVVTEDLLADERFRARAPEFGVPVRAAVAAPIGWGARPWGVLAVYSLVTRHWSDDEVHFVQSVANTMGLAVFRARVEAELRDNSARLDLSLSAGGLGAWSWDLATDRVGLSTSALHMYGLTPDAFGGTGDEFLALVHPDDRVRLRSDVYDAIATQREHHHLYRIIRHDTGELRWIETWGRLLGGSDHLRHLVGVSSDVTDRRRADQQREDLLAREHAARVEAERARERLAFLSEASAVLADSLDPEVTLDRLAELCVPTLADACVIDTYDDEHHLVEVAARATSEAVLAEARARRAVDQEPVERRDGTQRPPPAHDDGEVVAVLRTRGRVIGALSLWRVGDAGPFDADDRALVEDLAGRAALAIDNGRLFRSRNRVARSLQAALLPPALPAIPGLDLAARYQVAESDTEIGGDFYDVIEASPSSWAFVIGDVCGRGPDAAALTGLVRHTLRTAVLRVRQPSRVLAQTNEAILGQIDPASFCTAAYLRVELDEVPTAAPPGSVLVSASSAGHPRPAVVRADGEAALLACGGSLLGVLDEPELVDASFVLAPGDAVVLYTDGVTEARRGRQLFGERRLIEALEALAGRSAEDIAAGLEAAVAEFRTSAKDDTAILVVRATPSPGD